MASKKAARGAPSSKQDAGRAAATDDRGPTLAQGPDTPPRARRGPLVFLILALLLLLVAFMMVRHYLTAIVLALVLGYLLIPVHERLVKHVRKPWISSTLLLLAVTVVLLAPFVILVFRFVEDARRFVSSIESREDVTSQVADWLTGIGLPDRHVQGASTRLVARGAEYLQGAAVPVATLATEFLLALLIFYILLFYVIVDGKQLVRHLEHVTPAPDKDIHRMMERIGDRTKAIAMGTLVVALVQGLIAGLGWWLLGLPAPVFWGFVLLVLSLIPIIGAFIVLLPAAAWAFLQGDIFAGVGLLILNFVLVGLVDDVLRPMLIGRRSHVHPALILLGIVGGIPVFGIGGFILGPLLMGLVGPMFQVWSHPEDDEGRNNVE